MNKICCIYKIINLKTSKFYLGSTVDFFKRNSTHFQSLKKGIHHSQYLQNSFNKHGMDNFVIEIFQFCFPEEIKIQNKLKLLDPQFIEKIRAIKVDIKLGLRAKDIQIKYSITKSFYDGLKSGKNYPYV